MKSWRFALLLAGLSLLFAPFSLAAGGAGPGDVDEKDVVVLTESNFDATIKKSKFALVEFYAPWCGHCKALTPHYAKAATALKEFDDSIIIGKVDATVEKSLGEKFQVKGYPTLKWFVDGEMHSDYNGGRDTEGITKWVMKKTGPPAATLSSEDELSALEGNQEVIVVGYFKEFSGAGHEGFTKVASKMEDVTFIQTSNAKVAQAAGLDAAGVAVVKNFKGEARETVKLEKEVTAENIEVLAKGEKLPLTIEFSKQTAHKIFNSGIDKHIIFWSKADDVKADSKLIKVIKTVAKEFKGKLIFVISNNEDEEADPITKHFGLKDSPSLLGFIMDKNKKFKFSGEFTEAAVKDFATSVLDGTAVADYKSAAIPEDNIEDSVTVVVGKSFEDIVMDKTKDVLLEVYAPWCGHCKKLAPTYTKLAQQFENVDSVVIAKFDGTENEHEKVEAKGFPTILFFPAGEDKTPITFEGGDRSLESLTKFIKKHATVPYELPKKADEETSDLKPEKDAKDEL